MLTLVMKKEINKVIEVENVVKYAEDKLKELDRTVYNGKLWVERTPLAITLRFHKPNDDIIFKYSLSEMNLTIDGKHRKYVHMFVMQNVTKEKIDQLIYDLKQDDAFVFEPLEHASTITNEKSEVQRISHVPLHSRGYSGN